MSIKRYLSTLLACAIILCTMLSTVSCNNFAYEILADHETLEDDITTRKNDDEMSTSFETDTELDTELDNTIPKPDVNIEIKKTITVVGTMDFYPYEYVSNGEYVGVHIDLAKELARRNGWDVVFEATSFDKIIDGVRKGVYDIAFGIDKTADREEIVHFIENPYYSDEFGEMYAIFLAEDFGEWSDYRVTMQNMIDDGTVERILKAYNLS